MTLQVQFATMGMMLLGGLSLGGLYDLYRVLAGQLRAPRFAYYLLDLFFWLVGTLLVFKLLYASNLGEVRLFIFIGVAVGMTGYFLWFSPTVIRVIIWGIKAFQTMLRIGKKMIDLFIVTPIVWLYKAVIIFLGFLVALAIFIYKIMVQLIYPVWKLLLWLISPIRRRWIMPAWVTRTGQRIGSFFRWLFDRG